MPWSLLLNPTVALGIALALALGWGSIQTHRLGSAQEAVQAITAQFAGFRAQVAAEGKIAQAKADTQALTDKLRKEKADETHKAAVALRDQRIASLRHDADSSGRYLLPASAPGAARPDVACFDRGAFELASRNALAGLREIADICDGAIISLNIAKAWAQLPAKP